MYCRGKGETNALIEMKCQNDLKRSFFKAIDN